MNKFEFSQCDVNQLANQRICGKGYYLKALTADAVGESYLLWLLDDEVNQYLESRFTKYTLESLRAHVAGFDFKTKFFFGLFDSSTDAHIGNFNLHLNKEHQTVYYGYLIGDKKYWGKSAALVGTYLTLKFSFEALRVRKVWGSIYLTNIGAIINVKKFGFKEEGKQVAQYIYKGAPTDGILVGLKCEDWFSQQDKLVSLYE
jgi:RimJ/RimL family protein N-acetyltransferase